MKGDPNVVEETTRAALPLNGRRDAWLEQRLGYLISEQARLKGGVPLRRFLRGALAAYRRFLLTDDPAHRFHCWATIQAVSAGLDWLERGEADREVSGSAADGPEPERPLAAGLANRPHRTERLAGAAWPGDCKPLGLGGKRIRRCGEFKVLGLEV